MGLLFTIKVQFRKVVWSGFSVLLSTFQYKAPWGDCCDVENDFGLFLSAGKWAYEVLISSQGLMQIGWCTLSCRFNQEVYTHLDDEPVKALTRRMLWGKQNMKLDWELVRAVYSYVKNLKEVNAAGSSCRSTQWASMAPLRLQTWTRGLNREPHGKLGQLWRTDFLLFFLLSLFSHKVQYCCYEGGNDLYTPNSLCIRM